jgi:hypothetical protein
MVPTATYRFLERKKARLEKRLLATLETTDEIRREIEEVTHAQTALATATNGKGARSLRLVRNIKFTQRDFVLEAIKTRPKSGIKRSEIVLKLAQRGLEINPNSIATFLYRLQKDGFVRFDGGLWFPIASGGRIPAGSEEPAGTGSVVA